MLARLEDALGCSDLAKQMVLLPQNHPVRPQSLQNINHQAFQEINLVVGYNGSPQSQTALDLTLWIAHQTRLATRKQVTVQVVYVVNLEDECNLPVFDQQHSATIADSRKAINHQEMGNSRQSTVQRGSSAIAELPGSSESSQLPHTCQFEKFEQADRILWQARHLANEWRGSLKTHLRFGPVARELRDVVQSESATLLVLGCHSPRIRS